MVLAQIVPWGKTLKKTTFDFRRRDGRWQTQSRETYDRGDGCAVLLYSRRRACVLLSEADADLAAGRSSRRSR